MHGIIGIFKEQSVEHTDRFVSNSDIYNWKELNKKYKLKAKNDSELLFRLIETKGVNKLKSVLGEIDGVFAFAYRTDDSLYLVRDILGVKPMFYSHSNGFAFAFEKKELEKLGHTNIHEQDPRKIIKYDIKEDKIGFIKRDFFSILPENKKSLDKIKSEVKALLTEAISKRFPDKHFGLLFSGGVDSTTIAMIAKNLKKGFTCYTAALSEPGMSEPQDLVYAKKVAKELGLKLKIKLVRLSEVEKYLKKVVPLIEDASVVKVGVALPFFIACELAKKDNIKVIFSGLGSEEIFAGYQRHKDSSNINKECLSGLMQMHERDTYRDYVVTMHNSLNLRVPFLDKKLVDYSLKIPAKYKISGGSVKFILRQLAEDMGLKKEFAWRKKAAAQYGSKFDRAIKKLTKKAGLNSKSEYLERFI